MFLDGEGVPRHIIKDKTKLVQSSDMQTQAQHDHEKGSYKGTQTMVHEQDSEIDLSDVIRTLIKRRKIILASVFAAVIVASGYAFLAPKVYEVSMVIEPPVLNGMQPLDAIGNMQARVEAGAYDIQIIRDLGIKDYRLRLSFNQPERTQLLKISVDEAENNTELGIRILKSLLEILSSHYVRYIEEKEAAIDDQIKTSTLQINTKENDIKLKNEELKILGDRELQLSEELRANKAESAKLLDKRENLFERKEGRDDVAALLYATTLQQNAISGASLLAELNGLKSKKESMLNEIKLLNNSIEETRISIRSLNASKKEVKNIVVIQEPLVSLSPVWPKKKQIVSFGGMLGLVFGLLVAAFVERQEKDKARSHLN